MNALRFAAAALTALLSTGTFVAACASAESGNGATAFSGGNPSGDPGGGPGGSGSGGGIPAEICLLHNCSADIECKGCSDGRTTCLVAEHRCVACDSGMGTGCGTGEKCSSYGKCVPEELECPTNNGIPTIDCNANADCGACDPAHQICDTVAHKCVACTSGDVSECQSTDTCTGGDCAPKCPGVCATDSDCSECGAPGHEAHACNNHKCGECSPTFPCTGGKVCGIHGTCEVTCGIPGDLKGSCETDSDCAGCEVETKDCHSPINGGHGTCGPSATGCSDLGPGVVLPEPFDKVTNLCSNDMDCANIGIEFNVGKMLRDLTGLDLINDANIDYSMHVCASVSLQDKSCGVCVPCKVDTDCTNINIDQVAGEAFGPVGSIAAAFLLDKVFGPGDHEIHMYCEPVAAGYGVCVPCPGLLNGCGTGDPVQGSGNCGHETCVTGEALDPTCTPCAAQLCAVDPYCCTVAWDDACVAGVDLYCSDTCEGPGNEGCSHDQCDEGNPLDASCTDCTAKICDIDPYCCQTAWDIGCVKEVASVCCALCGSTCDFTCQCWPEGCLADLSCGPCFADYDCFPKVCDMNSGQCVDGP